MILIFKLEQPDWFCIVVGMDFFGWLWVVVLCFWVVRASAMINMGKKVLSDLKGVTPIMLKMSWWEIFMCVWAILAIFSILAVSMERSKNTRKGKAISSAFYGVSRKKNKGRYFANCEKGKRKEERAFIRKGGRK